MDVEQRFVAAAADSNHHRSVRRKVLSCLGPLFFALTTLPAKATDTTTPSPSKPPVLLVVGDSLSAEYGLARGHGWVARLEQRLVQQRFAYRIVNASISGETTSGGRTRLPALLARHRPAIVVIELGANDGLRGLPLATAEANLRAMLDASRKGGARTLLIGMRIPPNYGTDYADNFAALYARLAKETRTPLVPFLLVGFADRAEMFQPDRIHPLDNAQPLILDTVWPKLEPLLQARSRP